MHRSHHAIQPKNIVANSTTGEFMLPHNIAVDGYYGNRKIFIKNQTTE